MRCLSVAVLTLAAAASAQAPSSPSTPPNVSVPTVADWRNDLDEMIAHVRLTHPDPFVKIGQLTFARAAQQLRLDLPTLTNEQRVVRAMQLVASIGDGHTQLEVDRPDFALWYPVRLGQFADGYFVTSAHRSVADLAAAQVIAIGGRPVDAAMQLVHSLMATENAFDRMERLYPVHNASMMKGLGLAKADGSIEMTFRLRDGKQVTRVLIPRRTDNPRYVQQDASTFEWTFMPEMYGTPVGTPSEWVSAFQTLPATAFEKSDTTRPAHLVDRLAFGTRYFASASTYYARTNYVSDTDFAPFIRRVLHEVDSLKPRRFILDFRYNFGGDGSKVFQMVQELLMRRAAPPWKELYVLTGKKTFSAGIMAVNAILNNADVTVVGEPAGAALNSFGDPIEFPLLRTGLKLSVSSLHHQLSSSDDISEYMRVDVPAPFSFADYIAGRDPAVDAIARGDEMRSVPIILASDGAGPARKAYQDRVQRFGALDWWAPPREIDLRFVCQARVEQQRFQEALDICALNTEIHPDIWNVWYNLGRAQRAAGLVDERLRSYKCVLALDPTNHNGRSIRPLLAAAKDSVTLPERCPAGK